MKFFALVALIAATNAVKINGVNGGVTTDSWACKGTPKQIKTCSDSMKAYATTYTDAYDANVESHQENVATAKSDMKTAATLWTKTDDDAYKAREAAVKAADSNPHD